MHFSCSAQAWVLAARRLGRSPFTIADVRHACDLARAFECAAPHLKAFADGLVAPDKVPHVRPDVAVRHATRHASPPPFAAALRLVAL